MTFESTVRWLVAATAILLVVLSGWTAFGQDAPNTASAAGANNQRATPVTTGPQAVLTEHDKTEAAATTEHVTAVPPKSEAKADVGAASTTSTEVPTINNWKDKVSYAFGVDLARDLKRQKNDLNIDLLVRAMKDALADKSLALTDDEVTKTLKRVEAEQKQDYEHAKMMVAEKNRKAGEAFFAENAKKEGVVTLPSGLQYKIVKKGEGKVPTLEDRIVCKYKETLLDGTEFDSSEKRGGQIAVPVKGLMAGWTQALQLMPVGSKWQLFIPPQLAYGDKVIFGLGPNTTLIFDVELISIEDKPQTAQATQTVGVK